MMGVSKKKRLLLLAALMKDVTSSAARPAENFQDYSYYSVEHGPHIPLHGTRVCGPCWKKA